MKAIYYQKGETLDYYPEEDVEAGQVVSLGTRIGVTAAPVEAGEQGAVHVEGVFSMKKAEGEEIAQGDALYFDEASETITASEGGIPAGYAAQASSAADSAVLVKLLG